MPQTIAGGAVFASRNQEFVELNLRTLDWTDGADRADRGCGGAQPQPQRLEIRILISRPKTFGIQGLQEFGVRPSFGFRPSRFGFYYRSGIAAPSLRGSEAP